MLPSAQSGPWLPGGHGPGGRARQAREGHSSAQVGEGGARCSRSSHTPYLVCSGGILTSSHTSLKQESQVRHTAVPGVCPRPVPPPWRGLPSPRRVGIGTSHRGRPRGFCWHHGRGSWIHLWLIPALAPTGSPQPPPLLPTAFPEPKGHEKVHRPSCHSRHLPRPSAPRQGLSWQPPREWAPPHGHPRRPRRAGRAQRHPQGDAGQLLTPG